MARKKKKDTDQQSNTPDKENESSLGDEFTKDNNKSSLEEKEFEELEEKVLEVSNNIDDDINLDELSETSKLSDEDYDKIRKDLLKEYNKKMNILNDEDDHLSENVSQTNNLEEEKEYDHNHTEEAQKEDLEDASHEEEAHEENLGDDSHEEEAHEENLGDDSHEEEGREEDLEDDSYEEEGREEDLGDDSHEEEGREEDLEDDSYEEEGREEDLGDDSHEEEGREEDLEDDSYEEEGRGEDLEDDSHEEEGRGEDLEDDSHEEEGREEDLEDNLQEEMHEENLEDTPHQEEKKPTNNYLNKQDDKYDFDDDNDEEFELEEVKDEAASAEDNQPKELTEAQKVISPDVDQGISKVAISKGSSMATMVAMGAGLLFVVYKMLQPSPEELATQTVSQIDAKAPINKPIKDVGQTIVVPEIPKLPEVPTLSAPTPPPVPAPPAPPIMQLDIPAPPPPPPPVVKPKEEEKPKPDSPAVVSVDSLFGNTTNQNQAQLEAQQRKKEKMKSNMLVGGGGGTGPKNLTDSGQSMSSLSLNNSKIVATYIGELQRIIAQGKVIDAVLETAINTDLPGTLRAIVSRDVYSESGKNVLIPRGSRLVGTYSSAVTFGISRVKIAWNRVIRPDGIDVAISSPGIDNLGRTGTPGDVDNHVMRNLATALMVSTLDVALATYLDKNGGDSSDSSTVTVTGGISTTGQTTETGAVVNPTVTTGTPPSNTQAASAQTLANVQDVGKQLLAKTMAMPPTITINQGTPLKVYVQKDIFFPGRSANLTRIVE